jgi:hypothetical protein
MLLAKLQTPATKVYQVSPFETKTATAEYMVVAAQKYVIGTEDVTFELRFCNIIEENDEERLDIVNRMTIVLTQEELITWGTDDSVLLDLVAAKLNNSVVEKITREDLYQTY